MNEKVIRSLLQLCGAPFAVWLWFIDWRLLIIIFFLIWTNNVGFKRWDDK